MAHLKSAVAENFSITRGRPLRWPDSVLPEVLMAIAVLTPSLHPQAHSYRFGNIGRPAHGSGCPLRNTSSGTDPHAKDARLNHS
jgi:hypothetical protein